MRRGIDLVVLGTAMLLFAGFANAQQTAGKVHRIGFLRTTSGSSSQPTVAAFLDGMRQHGYAVNQDLIIEYRSADGKNDRLPELAADLVRLKVEVIVTSGTQATLAAKNATAIIPIVMTGSSDPLGRGLAKTLAQPGGNVTGISTMNVELIGKRLEIFRETFPKARNLAVLWYTPGNISFREIQSAAQPFGFNSLSLEVAQPEDFSRAFALAGRERLEGLFTGPAAFLNAHRKQIIDFAGQNKLPAIYHQGAYVEDGGLMSYAANNRDSHRRAAVLVDKILKGRKPADLPVEQPTKFEFVVNLKSAKQIGVTIPPNVLVRADKVIR